MFVVGANGEKNYFLMFRYKIGPLFYFVKHDK